MTRISQRNLFSLRRVALGLFSAGLLGFSTLSNAIDPITVRDIRVEGLQRVEPGTVFVTLPFQVGDTYNEDKA